MNKELAPAEFATQITELPHEEVRWASEPQAQEVPAPISTSTLPPAEEPPTPPQIDEADLLRYQLRTERVRTAELLVEMYTRELQRAMGERETTRHELTKFLKSVEAKYSVNLRLNMITDDGFLVPRPIQQRGPQLGGMIRQE